MGNEKKILRYWIRNDGSGIVVWFQNSIEFLNHMKTLDGQAGVKAGCRGMTIDEWKTFKAGNSELTSA